VPVGASLNKGFRGLIVTTCDAMSRSVATKKLRDFAPTKASIDLCTHLGQIVNKTFKSFPFYRKNVMYWISGMLLSFVTTLQDDYKR
jgi:hypothetical protein